MIAALVTGGNGFLAASIVRALRRDAGIRIVGADLGASDRSGIYDDYVQMDVGDPESVVKGVETVRPDRVFHTAGVANSSPILCYRVNAMGTAQLLDTLLKTVPNSRVVVIGSAAEYGGYTLGTAPLNETAQCNPASAYGASKLAGTLAGQMYGRQFGLQVVALRLFNIIGRGIPESLLLGALTRRAVDAVKNGTFEVRIGNIEAERDFLSVGDAADACLAAIEKGSAGEIYNVCSGEAVTVGSIATQLLAQIHAKLRLVIDPALDRGADSSVGSWQKAHRDFGFEPRTSLSTVLAEIRMSIAGEVAACASA